MSTRSLHRAIHRTPEELARPPRRTANVTAREKPTPEQLLKDGGHEDFVTLGELLSLHEALAYLKRERLRQNLTLRELSERTGIDEAALSRLENGQNSNPKVDTMYRVASALGKTISWTFEDAQATQAVEKV